MILSPSAGNRRKYVDSGTYVREDGPDAISKKFNSRLVAPTVFRNDPFGECVEGLSPFIE